MSKTSRRSLLGAASRSPPHLRSRPSVAHASPALSTADAADDPIFVAIDRHKAAVAATEASGEDDVSDKLSDRDTALARKLMATVPTTRAGLLAMLGYVQHADETHAISLKSNDDQLAALLSSIEGAVRTLPNAKGPAATAARNAKQDDPIFVAVKTARATFRAWLAVCDQIDRAETRALKKYGNRPLGLIAWRHYSAIGHDEIDRAREEFLLLPAIDPKKIEREYRDAKARERAAQRDQQRWDKRTGLANLRRKFEALDDADRKAHMRMAETCPTTPEGAASLLAYVAADMETITREWHTMAVKTVVASLWLMAQGNNSAGVAKAA